MAKKTKLQEQLPCKTPDLKKLTTRLHDVRDEILKLEKGYKKLSKVHPQHRNSARNLLHYLAFRSQDLRKLQIQLSGWGLSALSGAERKVQATVDTLLHVMYLLRGKEWNPKEKPPICFRQGRRQLEKNAKALLGRPSPGRRVRIMVTMPTEAATNSELIVDLLQNGMNCARINCAHDGPEVWAAIIANIRRIGKKLNKKCRIHMDLGGPKLRTGPVEPGPAVVKVRPHRSESGIVLAGSRIWFYPEGSTNPLPEDVDACLSVSGEDFEKVLEGSRLRLTDARGSNRRLIVLSASPYGRLAMCEKTIYFSPGTEVRILEKPKQDPPDTFQIGSLPNRPGFIFLKNGDTLQLSKKELNGRSAIYDEAGNVLEPAIVSCSIPSILDDVKLGQQVWFDDGKLGGEIDRIDASEVDIRITHARPQGVKLRAEKGINLPDTKLKLSALTEEDLSHLDFVVKHAHSVGLSFANTSQDVKDLIREMRKRKKNIPGIVIKVETPRGFENLPNMLLAGMRAPVAGVMIARGDLAIECGFGRLAEVQEQILWICEAAHIPVIWATQVLETLAKSGMPSRAEITDAAMGERAECIMLNKGEHIAYATMALGSILHRMQDHQTKKRSMLRKLHIAGKYFSKL